MEEISKETLLLLAHLYLQHSKYKKALNLFKALKQLYPDNAHINRSLAYTHLKLEDFEAALQNTEQSLLTETSPGLIIASNLIKSRALWGLGQKQVARHTLTQLVGSY